MSMRECSTTGVCSKRATSTAPPTRLRSAPAPPSRTPHLARGGLETRAQVTAAAPKKIPNPGTKAHTPSASKGQLRLCEGESMLTGSVPCRGGSPLLRPPIHLDPVRAHLHPHRMAEVVRDQQARRQRRHVAIDAAARQLLPVLGEETTTLRRVTRQAPPRERDDVALLTVHVVARGAGHLRRAEALAPLQQGDLVAVHVDVPRVRSGPQVRALLEGLPGHVGERRCTERRGPTVAQGALVHLSGAGQPRRVDDRAWE